MKKLWDVLWLELIGILIITMSYHQPILAKSWTSENRAALLVRPILPADNIGGKSRGYFDLKASAKERSLKVHVFNTTTDSLTVRASVVEAGTLDNGVIDYSGQKRVNPQLLAKPGAQLIDIDHQTVIPAQSGVDLIIKIKPFNFSGIKASALKLVVVTEQKNSSIQNQYVYGIAVILNGRSATKKQAPQLKATKIKPRLNNQGKPVLSVRIANQRAAFVHKRKMQVRLQNQRWGLISYVQNREKVSIAPKTDFYYDLPLEGKRLVPGRYQLTVVVDGHKQKKQIVKITKNAARLINQQNDTYLKRQRVYLVGGGLLGLSMLLIGYGVWHKRRKFSAKEKDS